MSYEMEMRWKWLHSTFNIIKIFSYLGSEARLLTFNFVFDQRLCLWFHCCKHDTITLHTCISLVVLILLNLATKAKFPKYRKEKVPALQNIASTIRLVCTQHFYLAFEQLTHKTFCDNFFCIFHGSNSIEFIIACVTTKCYMHKCDST